MSDKKGGLTLKQRMREIMERMGLVEKLARDGIDGFAKDIRVLYANQMELADATHKIDLGLAALRSLLIRKGLLTASEYEEMIRSIEKAADEAKEKALADRKMLDELHQLHQPPTEDVPEGAFIFGGD